MVYFDPTYFLLPTFESHTQLLWSDFFLSIKQYVYICNTQKEKLNTRGTHKIEGGNSLYALSTFEFKCTSQW